MEEPVPAVPQDFLEAKEIRFRCLLVSIHVTAYKILLISTVFFAPEESSSRVLVAYPSFYLFLTFCS
jgi:hypothetical protein